MSTPKIRLQLAKQLKILRKKSGYSQEKMAERAKVNTRYYQRLESKDPGAIKVDTLEKIAKALNLPAWKLLKFKD